MLRTDVRTQHNYVDQNKQLFIYYYRSNYSDHDSSPSSLVEAGNADRWSGAWSTSANTAASTLQAIFLCDICRSNAACIISNCTTIQ